MATFSIPLEVLRGMYLGILTGVLPALLAFGFGFLFRYVTGVSIPAFAVIVLGLALAGVNGGLLAIVDPSITQSANSVALMTAVVVVLMLSLYTHSLGDRLAATVPRHFSFRSIRETTISADVVDFVGGRGEVRVSVVGEVRDMEGYPPIPEPLRDALGAVQWRFPADLPIEELEARMAERFRTEFELQAVEVAIDARGRANVAAAPPHSGVSRRLDSGMRAVSLDALVPTGVARGETVTVLTDDATVDGIVVSARSGAGTEERPRNHCRRRPLWMTNPPRNQRPGPRRRSAPRPRPAAVVGLQSPLRRARRGGCWPPPRPVSSSRPVVPDANSNSSR
jgi:hypothetical protein